MVMMVVVMSEHGTDADGVAHQLIAGAAGRPAVGLRRLVTTRVGRVRSAAARHLRRRGRRGRRRRQAARHVGQVVVRLRADAYRSAADAAHPADAHRRCRVVPVVVTVVLQVLEHSASFDFGGSAQQQQQKKVNSLS